MEYSDCPTFLFCHRFLRSIPNQQISKSTRYNVMEIVDATFMKGLKNKVIHQNRQKNKQT